MIAAAYLRKSTSQEGIADADKSVTFQREHVAAFIARQGWTFSEAHVFVDDGISGAEFERRPGYVRLMASVKPRAPFEVLVMYDDSRLGREQIEVGYALKQLIRSGVRIFYSRTGKECTLAGPLDKMMSSIERFASEMHRAETAARTRDKMLSKAKAGHVTGGVVFGYANVRAAGHVERRVVEAEAAVVRRIFEMATAGDGYRRIAVALNDAGAVAPKPRRTTTVGWSPSTVRDVLMRDLYRGVVVWGKRRKRNSWGEKRPALQPKDGWTIVPGGEHLRIVPDDLWEAAHSRLSASRAVYLRATNGHTHGRPANGMESRYLLTGLLSCGVCGGSLFVHSHDFKREGRRHHYGCTTYHLRGAAVCPNGLEAPMVDTDTAVLGAVEQHVLRVDVLETALAKALDLLRPDSEALEARARSLRGELAQLDAEVGRLAAAIAGGGELAALLAALQERERRRTRIRQELAVIERDTPPERFDVDHVLDELRGKLADWQGLLRQETAHARPALRALLAGRLIFTPRETDAGRYYEFEGPGTLDNVFTGLVLPKALVTPAGYDDRWAFALKGEAVA